ncbi:adenylate/guanylate cyclase domain-containing protein [Rapidithrix thailandica]|uniref:Adenylate cyclase n=1 Tax=Rapidithrix thailandica TaxID=413964 RepID=A0AAW9SBW8_9BACT
MQNQRALQLLFLYSITILLMGFIGANLTNLERKFRNIEKKGDSRQMIEMAWVIVDKCLSEKRYGTAKKYYEKIISEGKKISDWRSVADASLRLGDQLSDATEYQMAIPYYLDAVRNYLSANAERQYVNALFKLGRNYHRTRYYKRSITVLEKALSHVEQNNVPFPEKYFTYKILEDCYSRTGMTSRADYLNSLMVKKKEVVRQETAREIQEIEKLEEVISTKLMDTLRLTRDELFAVKSQKRELEVRKKILEEENKKHEDLIEQQLEYINHKELELALAQEQDKNRKIQIIASIACLVVFAIAVIVLIVVNRRTRRINRQLELQNIEILKQAREIKVQKERIKDQNKKLELEKVKSDTLLLNILPRSIAEELKEKGRATPKHFDNVSVLFTDFKGFTTVAEKLSPSEIVKELDECFLAFDEIAEKHNLEKIKTIGDAYMCAGGVPIPNHTNPVDAVKAGLAMQEFMQNRKLQKMREGRMFFELRVGVHTGPIVAGVVGKKKFAFDIWGDTVNLASRMESGSEVGRVNISGITYQYVKEYFYCSYRGKISAKNKGDVDMYYVNGMK